MKSQPKHPCVKNVAKNLKKATLKKMLKQNGQPRPPDVDGIKTFDNDDQATKITVVCHNNYVVSKQQ